MDQPRINPGRSLNEGRMTPRWTQRSGGRSGGRLGSLSAERAVGRAGGRAVGRSGGRSGTRAGGNVAEWALLKGSIGGNMDGRGTSPGGASRPPQTSPAPARGLPPPRAPCAGGPQSLWSIFHPMGSSCKLLGAPFKRFLACKKVEKTFTLFKTHIFKLFQALGPFPSSSPCPKHILQCPP